MFENHNVYCLFTLLLIRYKWKFSEIGIFEINFPFVAGPLHWWNMECMRCSHISIIRHIWLTALIFRFRLDVGVRTINSDWTTLSKYSVLKKSFRWLTKWVGHNFNELHFIWKRKFYTTRRVAPIHRTHFKRVFARQIGIFAKKWFLFSAKKNRKEKQTKRTRWRLSHSLPFFFSSFLTPPLCFSWCIRMCKKSCARGWWGKERN